MSAIFRGIGMWKESEFKSQVVESHGHRLLAFSGDLDKDTAEQIMQVITEFLDEGEPHLIIDMHDVVRITSKSLFTFMSAVKRLVQAGGTVNLVGCIPRVENKFNVTGLVTYIALHQNMDDAMEAAYGYAGPGPPASSI